MVGWLECNAGWRTPWGAFAIHLVDRVARRSGSAEAEGVKKPDNATFPEKTLDI